MSAYRLNYIPEPARCARPRLRLALLAALGLFMAAALLALCFLIPGQLWPEAPMATPVSTPQIEVTDLEPLALHDVAQARIDGFRAGYLTAIIQGDCSRGVTLSSPVAQR